MSVAMNLSDETESTFTPPTIAAVPALGPAFTIDRKAFAAALTRLKSVTGSRSSMPIFAHVKVTVDDGYVTLRATNLAVDVSITLEATTARPGETCFPCKALLGAVGKGPGSVSIDGARVTSGASSSTIMPMPADDFPASVGARPAKPIAVIDFKRSLKRAAFCMSTDDTRPHLAGMLLERNDGAVRLVATDGHRLALAIVGQDSRADFLGIVPSCVIGELARWKAGPVSVFMSDTSGPIELPGKDAETARAHGSSAGWRPRHVWFATATGVVSGRLADTTFPSYGQVIPQSFDRSARVSRAAFIAAVKSAALISSDRTSGVKFTLTVAGLRIQSENPDVGETDATIAADITGNPGFQFGLNSRYLIETLEAVEDESVTLELAGELDSVMLHATDGSVYVIMPMRV